MITAAYFNSDNSTAYFNSDNSTATSTFYDSPDYYYDYDYDKEEVLKKIFKKKNDNSSCIDKRLMSLSPQIKTSKPKKRIKSFQRRRV